MSFDAPVIMEEELPVSTYRILNNRMIRDTVLVTKKWTIINPHSPQISGIGLLMKCQQRFKSIMPAIEK